MSFDDSEDKKEEEATAHSNVFSPLEKMPPLRRRQSHVIGIPKDKKLILKMLLRPAEYGAGLFDYSCHGANWDISDEVLGR